MIGLIFYASEKLDLAVRRCGCIHIRSLSDDDLLFSKSNGQLHGYR